MVSVRGWGCWEHKFERKFSCITALFECETFSCVNISRALSIGCHPFRQTSWGRLTLARPSRVVDSWVDPICFGDIYLVTLSERKALHCILYVDDGSHGDGALSNVNSVQKSDNVWAHTPVLYNLDNAALSHRAVAPKFNVLVWSSVVDNDKIPLF